MRLKENYKIEAVIVTVIGQGFVQVRYSPFGQLGTEADWKTNVQVSFQLFTCVPSAEYVAGMRFIADVSSVSQHSRKSLLYAAISI